MTTPPEPGPSRWWSPHVYADRRPRLRTRARILSGWRDWFAREDFVEVETAALQVSPGNEAHIGAFATDLRDPEGERRLYLHTSPEFACKKLLAAGEPRLFTFAHVFRNGERGALHHPEFTMLEWYRAEACSRHADINLLATIDGTEPDRAALAAKASATGVRITPDDTWSDVFSKVLAEKIEPHLGRDRATILYDYPACEAALAQRSLRDPRVSERFELYVCGVELANGFGELTDADEQRRRFEHEMDERQRIYGERYPLDEDFLAALRLMPQASGIALGVDRLVMLATGAPRVEDVIWTPVVETRA